MAETAKDAPKPAKDSDSYTSPAKKMADDSIRWGESSDPEVHQRLAKIDALERNRAAAGGEPDKEAIAKLDAEIAAEYHQLETLNEPESVKLREQRQKAAAKGDVQEVAAIDAKLAGGK